MMQIVIDIPEKLACEGFERSFTEEEKNILIKAIGNGTPLPKGHGNLVDRNAINDRFYGIWEELESYSNKSSYKELLDKWSMCIDTAPTIIEADKTEGSKA